MTIDFIPRLEDTIHNVQVTWQISCEPISTSRQTLFNIALLRSPLYEWVRHWDWLSLTFDNTGAHHTIDAPLMFDAPTTLSPDPGIGVCNVHWRLQHNVLCMHDHNIKSTEHSLIACDMVNGQKGWGGNCGLCIRRETVTNRPAHLNLIFATQQTHHGLHSHTHKHTPFAFPSLVCQTNNAAVRR